MQVLIERAKWSMRVYCRRGDNLDYGCNSLLHIEEEDINLDIKVASTGCKTYFYSVECPVCGDKIAIPENKLPSTIKNRLIMKYYMDLQSKENGQSYTLK